MGLKASGANLKKIRADLIRAAAGLETTAKIITNLKTFKKR